jgi:hypothetical protein
MPSLLQPQISNVIRTIPVADHSIEIEAKKWRPKFQSAGLATLFIQIFGNASSLRITRQQLHSYPPGVQKCAKVLLWGYPTDQRGLASRLLPKLSKISSLAVNTPPTNWGSYYNSFKSFSGIGISTITKLAYFHGLSFSGQNALIHDNRVIENSKRWNEIALPRLSYSSANQNYSTYLQLIHQTSSVIGCTPDQLEFFVFALGNNF